MRYLIVVLIVLLLPVIAAAGSADTTAADEGWSVKKVGSDALSGLWLFVTDNRAVVTKPARMTHDDYIWLGTLLGGGAILFAFDADIDRAVQQNTDNACVKGVADAGDTFHVLGLMGKTNRYYIGGILVGYFTGWKPLQRISTDILFSHWIGGLYRNVFKIFVGRARPNQELGAYDFQFNASRGAMPSGHASTVVQLATIASRYTNWWPASVVYYSIAGTVLFQRIESREHWASDVWVGALNGSAIARLVMREHDDRDVIWVPSYIPETGTVGLYIQKNF
jgi:membrane-associated phospholipid phosphatase